MTDMEIVERACRDINRAMKIGKFERRDVEFMKDFFTAVAQRATVLLEKIDNEDKTIT